MLTCLVDIAGLLGRTADAADFARRADEVKAAFNAAFFNAAKGNYDRNSQTANAMPLALGMVPAGQEAPLLAALVADIPSRRHPCTRGHRGLHDPTDLRSGKRC